MFSFPHLWNDINLCHKLTFTASSLLLADVVSATWRWIMSQQASITSPPPLSCLNRKDPSFWTSAVLQPWRSPSSNEDGAGIGRKVLGGIVEYISETAFWKCQGLHKAQNVTAASIFSSFTETFADVDLNFKTDSRIPQSCSGDIIKEALWYGLKRITIKASWDKNKKTSLPN